MSRSCPTESPPARHLSEKRALVLSHTQIVLNEYEVVLHAPDVAAAAQAGQFIMMVFGEGHSTNARRPFSLYRVDPDAGTVSIVYLARGSFTSELARKEAGDILSIIGPLGSPFVWDQYTDSRHILVAGGIGAPPIYFLARELTRAAASLPRGSASVTVINAAKSADRLVGVGEFNALGIEQKVITLDGSSGVTGMATDTLAAELAAIVPSSPPVRVYACGPMPMLHRVSALCKAAAIGCQISIETPMPCGVGECEACMVRVRDETADSCIGLAKACWDGPVFDAEALVWDGDSVLAGDQLQVKNSA